MATAKSDPKIVRYFLAAGFLVPCLLYLVIVAGGVGVQGSLIWLLLVPWPTFPLIMSAETGGGSGGETIAFLISAGANVAVYGLGGSLFVLSIAAMPRDRVNRLDFTSTISAFLPGTGLPASNCIAGLYAASV